MQNITILLLASSLLFACGGNDDTTPIPAAQSRQEPGASNPPESTDPSPSTQPSSSTCNTLTNDAQAISAIAVVAETPPLPTGGTIPTGKYHLADITLYAGKTGKPSSIPITLQGTVKVTGTSVEQVLDGTKPDGTTVAERSTDSFTTKDNEVTFTKTCDGSGSTTSTYTSTATELTLFLVNDLGQTVAYKYR
jgi:hypothetical protein